MITQEKQVFLQLEHAKNILITFGNDWEGDSVAAALALFLFLRKMGKNTEIVGQKTENNKTARELFSFLPSISSINDKLENLCRFIVSLDIKNAKVDQIKYLVDKDTLNFIISPKEGFFTSDDVKSGPSGFKYDLILVVGASDLESLGEVYDNNIDFFYKTTIINIDHHPNNEEFGQVNYINLNSVAVCEAVYSLFKEEKDDLFDADIATCLLAGIIYKTKSFKTANLTPQALSATSDLIKLGGRREEVVGRLYRSRSLDSLKLWGRVLNNLNSAADNSLIWSTLYQEDLELSPALDDRLFEIIDELVINMPQIKIIALFYSSKENILSDNQTLSIHDGGKKIFASRVLIYSVKNFDVLEITKDFSPSGTKKIARLESSEPIAPWREKIITKLKEKLDKLS